MIDMEFSVVGIDIGKTIFETLSGLISREQLPLRRSLRAHSC